ncbi:hypothetical protein [Paenibacillus polymyxa]|jgi:hypothetical protein|nr:hypothetical protein [Paenibacillus polymyxa]
MKELGNYNLVFRKMKMHWFGFISILLLISFSFVFMPIEYRQYGLVVYFILTLIGIYIVNRKAKKVVLTTYGLKQDEIMWGGSEFTLYKEDKLKEYLESGLNFNLANKSSKIINALNKEIENTKLSIFFGPGIFVGLFIPLWNQYAVTQFKNISIVSDAVEVLVGHVIGIVIITYMVSVLRFVLSDVIAFRRTRLKELVSLIEAIDLKNNER